MNGEVISDVPEFDRSQYPEHVVCTMLPGGDEQEVEVQVLDVEGRGILARVPRKAVISLNVGRFSDKLPSDIKRSFDNDLGAGILACRVVERLETEELLRIEIPADIEDGILIPLKSLAKKHH